MKSKWLCLDDAKSKTACLLFPSTCCYLGNQPASNESIVINASSAIVKDGVVAAGEYNVQKKMPIFRNLAFTGSENLAKILDTRLLMIIFTFS